MPLHIEAIDFDCGDAQRVGRFWADALRTDLHGPDEQGVYYLESAPGRPELLFDVVPEAKKVKNRVHLDLRPDDQSAEVARLESLGARQVDIGQRDVSWVVMADPEGNEFCVLRGQRPDVS